MKLLLLSLLLLVGCATQAPRPLPVESKVPRITVIPTPPVVVDAPRLRSTPNYSLPSDAPEDFKQALELIKAYANSDEFYDYVLTKRKYFSHVDGKSVKQCVQEFRDQLDKGDRLEVVLYHQYFSKALGGLWADGKIHENTKFKMTPNERAGHWLHETSHKYGWSHLGNYVTKFDNENSFPYAIGYDFEDFLETKSKTLAVKP
jgi:hypothetical protein